MSSLLKEAQGYWITYTHVYVFENLPVRLIYASKNMAHFWTVSEECQCAILGSLWKYNSERTFNYECRKEN